MVVVNGTFVVVVENSGAVVVPMVPSAFSVRVINVRVNGVLSPISPELVNTSMVATIATSTNTIAIGPPLLEFRR